MENLKSQIDFTPTQVAKMFGTHANTVVRWILKGVVVMRGRNARRTVRLAGRKVGGRWKISQYALDEFDRTINGQSDPSCIPRRIRKRDADRELRRAMQGLRDMGIDVKVPA